MTFASKDNSLGLSASHGYKVLARLVFVFSVVTSFVEIKLFEFKLFMLFVVIIGVIDLELLVEFPFIKNKYFYDIQI